MSVDGCAPINFDSTQTLLDQLDIADSGIIEYNLMIHKFVTYKPIRTKKGVFEVSFEKRPIKRGNGFLPSYERIYTIRALEKNPRESLPEDFFKEETMARINDVFSLVCT